MPNALFKRPDVSNVAVTASYLSAGGSKVTLSGSATVTSSFHSIFGYHDVSIAASTSSICSNTRLRMALALDSTGSMAQDGKLGALTNASKSLLTILQNAAQSAGDGDGDGEVAILPSANGVNVGTSPPPALAHSPARRASSFCARSADEMVTTFNDIGTEIAKLRIAQ